MGERKQNILFISHDSGLYGAQRSLLDLLRTMNRDQCAVRVVLPCDGALAGELKGIGVPVDFRPVVHWVPSRMMFGRGYRRRFVCGLKDRVWGICGLIERYGIDVVYTNTVTVIEGALAARTARKAHIWHLREHVEHNEELKPLLPPWLCYKAVDRLSRAVVVNSESLRCAVNRYIGMARAVKVYNGVDCRGSDFGLDPSTRLKSQLGLGVGDSAVIFIGAIHPRKGLGFLVSVAGLVKTMGLRVRFLIVGDGDEPYVNALKKRICEQGLDNVFCFLGQRNKIGRYLAVSDVLVLTSNQEPFGRVLIEAMAAGKPVVATRSGGPEEIVIDGETGYLRKFGDVEGFASALSILLSDKEKAAQFGEAGRRRVMKHFDLVAQTERIQSLVQQVAASEHERSLW
ncbi:MAG TPA: glycosyltransferase family 1 protein [Gammaproteobacteria bacterium]|nr:glycosyltransferase family 1 protein [Gammaproteobacteria bacterium]